MHLDDEDAKDAERIKSELVSLLNQEPPSIEEKPRVFRVVEPIGVASDRWAMTRAGHFGRCVRPGLGRWIALPGLVEAKESAAPGRTTPSAAFVYLDLLRREDPLATFDEAERIAGAPGVPALMLSACINILATRAEQVPEDQLEASGDAYLPWAADSIRPLISIKRASRSLP